MSELSANIKRMTKTFDDNFETSNTMLDEKLVRLKEHVKEVKVEMIEKQLKINLGNRLKSVKSGYKNKLENQVRKLRDDMDYKLKNEKDDEMKKLKDELKKNTGQVN